MVRDTSRQRQPQRSPAQRARAQPGMPRIVDHEEPGERGVSGMEISWGSVWGRVNVNVIPP